LSIFSSGALSGASGGSDVWLLWGFADLAQPVCRAKDESRPAGAIVHAYSIVASRNGAAGYKLMRSSHPTWASTLNPIDDPMTGERDSRRKQQSTRHLEHAVVLDDVKAKPVVAAQGSASLDTPCARQLTAPVVGMKVSLRRGRTKVSGFAAPWMGAGLGRRVPNIRIVLAISAAIGEQKKWARRKKQAA
jgi:hypothetical protein